LYYTASGIITLKHVSGLKLFCASIWLITKINMLRYTVSKTSKHPLFYLHNYEG